MQTTDHIHRRTHTLFRKLPYGAMYWPQTSVASTTPLIKTKWNARNNGWTTEDVEQTTSVGLNVEVVRVPRLFTRIRSM